MSVCHSFRLCLPPSFLPPSSSITLSHPCSFLPTTLPRSLLPNCAPLHLLPCPPLALYYPFSFLSLSILVRPFPPSLSPFLISSLLPSLSPSLLYPPSLHLYPGFISHSRVICLSVTRACLCQERDNRE